MCIKSDLGGNIDCFRLLYYIRREVSIGGWVDWVGGFASRGLCVCVCVCACLGGGGEIGPWRGEGP